MYRKKEDNIATLVVEPPCTMYKVKVEGFNFACSR